MLARARRLRAGSAQFFAAGLWRACFKGTRRLPGSSPSNPSQRSARVGVNILSVSLCGGPGAPQSTASPRVSQCDRGGMGSTAGCAGFGCFTSNAEARHRKRAGARARDAFLEKA